MRKIPSVFKRDYEGTRLVFDEVVEGCEWVLKGEGRATVKWDGTACLWKDGKLWKRYDVKKGRTKPEEFIPAEEQNLESGHWFGWVPIGDGPEDKWHRQALEREANQLEQMIDGQTYELCGPKVQGNPERFDSHTLEEHGKLTIAVLRNELTLKPLTFETIRDTLKDLDMEGIVWYHPDGRMAKIKKRDFGDKRLPSVSK